MLVLVTASSRIVVVDGSIVTRMSLLGVTGDWACGDAVVWFWGVLVHRLLVMPEGGQLVLVFVTASGVVTRMAVLGMAGRACGDAVAFCS